MTALRAEEPQQPVLSVVPDPSPLPFSLLMSVYAGDCPEFLRRAFTSSVQQQVRRPDEVVLVQDGPVSVELACCIDALCAESPVPVQRVRLEQNQGLARALDAGLAACRYEVVARMDADDISLPDRFAHQLPEIESGADLVGSALLEIGADEHEVVGRRTPPTTTAVIEQTARLHDPFNHPTVVYRRSAVEAAGGYQHLPQMEDYWLFARMIASGARTTNRPEPLVLYRVGAGAYERRGGRALLRAELALQVLFLRSGFTTWREFARNVALRGLYRLVPAGVRRPAYRLIVATRGERLDRGR
ncbi:MAG: glycosyltransferase [Actinobacteria bacterium]|nr:glycosyltransferase [Actinomycetota bacterium]